jgi:hypothetical protein
MGKIVDLTGQTFKGLSVIKFLYLKDHVSYYLCQCLTCGKKFEIRRGCLKKQISCKECCDKSKLLDIAGKKFGRLLALSVIHQKGKVKWKCLCDCGKEHIAKGSSLINGDIKSCGCYNKEVTYARTVTHGMTRTAEYRTWSGIIQRATYTNKPYSKRYADRGITVCDSWRHSFEQFYKDMGARPSPEYSIDRINNDGNYEPSNCRWATRIEQCNNRSNSVFAEINGERKTITEWARIKNIRASIIYRRINRGWSPIEAIMLPPKRRRDITKKYLWIADALVSTNK